MPPLIEIPIGSRFGRLTVIEKVRAKRHTEWLCQCDCGKRSVVTGRSLRIGETQSCGCLVRENSGNRLKEWHRNRIRVTHPPGYKNWCAMMQRCYRECCNGYERYGGAGVTVCDRWRNSFDAFIADIGPKPGPKYTLDRIDNKRGYEPGNVRWATHAEQARNTRRNVYLTFNGVTKTLTDWALETNLSQCCIRLRLKRGWDTERALTTPPYHEGLFIHLECPSHLDAPDPECQECWYLDNIHRHLERAIRAGRLHEAHRAAREATTEPSAELTRALNVILPRKYRGVA